MANVLEIKVRVVRVPLSLAAINALKRLERYDWILFTSKNTVRFFAEELRERHMPTPRNPHIAAVGPVTTQALKEIKLRASVVPEVLTVKELVRALGDVRGKRILFPRSAIAPNDAISRLRSRGAIVRVINMYTTDGISLTSSEKQRLLNGGYDRLSFSSPSGIKGLIQNLDQRERRYVRTIPAHCIGPTTATAARAAGFKNVVRDDVL